MQVRWLSAVLDFPADQFGAEVTFWRAIAGATVSPPWGDARQFASLEPFSGDPHLRVQRIADGPGGVHLDLHIDDPHAGAAEALGLGATTIRDTGDYLTLRSPGGFEFCLVPWLGESRKSRPIRWPGDAISIIDQLCIDAPTTLFDGEIEFWIRLTGWSTRTSRRPEFVGLRRDPALTLGVLLQRLDRDTTADRVHAHMDIATSTVSDEVARHEDWGAHVVERFDGWTVMADPVGRRYCITDRNPRTGG